MKESNKGITIIETVKNKLCHGCGTCESLCPNSAICLTKNSRKGEYLPILDEQKCNQCGICFKVCPGHSVDFQLLNGDKLGVVSNSLYVGNYDALYIGHARDNDVRYHSTSGGMVTAFLIFALEEGIIDGALVTRMSAEDPLRPEPFIARNRKDIISAAGSKYCPVPVNIALKAVLENEGKYAVVGLPCHLHGLRKAQVLNKRLREQIVLCLGIFCGNTISFLGTEYLLNQLGVRKEEIEKLDYRCDGWPGNLTIYLKGNRKKISIPYMKYHDNMFGSFTPYRCTLCSDKLAELSDISFGDAWFPEFFVDKLGKSLLIVRNKEANYILHKIMSLGMAELNEITIDKLMQLQGGLEYFASWKKRKILCRLNIARFLGKRVPSYNNIENSRQSLKEYMNSCLLYLERFLAMRPYFWIFLNMYWALRERRLIFKKRRLGTKSEYSDC